MFERFNESAQRVVLLSRNTAQRLGGAAIEPPHVLLALLHQAPELFRPWLDSDEKLETLREKLEADGRGLTPTADREDITLGREAHSLLAYGAAEADRLGHAEVGPEHMLAGLLRSGDPVTQALRDAGMNSPEARLVFVAASNGSAEVTTEAEDLFRIIEQLPRSQLGRARALLQALLETNRTGGQD